MASGPRLPATQRALRQGPDGRLRLVQDAPMPPLPPGFVLIKTTAVALNHVDYKLLNNFPLPGSFAGTDFAGVVVHVNQEERDRVAGAAFLFADSHRLASGAFAEYVRAPAAVLLRLNSTSLTPLEASTLPTGVMTCILAFWAPDALALTGTPDEPQQQQPPPQVLVHGGSTTTGTFAVQLLKLSGYDPVATCSAHNFDLVRRCGASAVFDAQSGALAAHIKQHTRGRLRYALDCVSSNDGQSTAVCYGAIQRPGGRYASLNTVADGFLAQRRAVKPHFVLAAEVVDAAVELGHPDYDRPASKQKHDLAVQHATTIQRLLDQGRLRPHPVEELQGGLDAVVAGLDRLENGRVSGVKLVARM
ncbi:chaperonin 10-like protein [Coniella lustricola]|uniref:Chaperonin 10-like protein n=1 Tax=Coniella lustricola TaxID=2025994 RepID=A0A2T3A0H0_9PEZI|nr:chaperonin 10-like protein [Coniella lustricola]